MTMMEVLKNHKQIVQLSAIGFDFIHEIIIADVEKMFNQFQTEVFETN
jgi:hypothetical protein